MQGIHNFLWKISTLENKIDLLQNILSFDHMHSLVIINSVHEQLSQNKHLGAYH